MATLVPGVMHELGFDALQTGSVGKNGRRPVRRKNPAHGHREPTPGADSGAVSEHHWQPPTEGLFFGSALSLEFSLPDGEETARFFSITARGTGNILEALLPLTTRQGWTIFDIGSSEFITTAMHHKESPKPPTSG